MSLRTLDAHARTRPATISEAITATIATAVSAVNSPAAPTALVAVFVAVASAACGPNYLGSGTSNHYVEAPDLQMILPDFSSIFDPTKDHDNDGYTPNMGDCDDYDAFVNPGAFEIPANFKDDNCNGMTDETPPPCDAVSNKADPLSLAAAVELCTPWITGATLNQKTDPTSHAILTDFGVYYKPKAGKSFVYLANGIAADENDANYVNPQPGTQFQNTEANPLPLKTKNICSPNVPNSASPTVNDLVKLSLTIKVPTNANSFSFSLNFFSSEYPEYVGNQYNDQFLAVLESDKFVDAKGTRVPTNISFDPNGDPITVNSGFLAVCESQPICANGGHTCAKECRADLIAQHHLPACELNGTGYEVLDEHDEMVGGATGWLTTTAPVKPGETITLTFAIFDSGDRIWDSGVLIDNFQWGVDPAAAAMTGVN